MGQYEKAVKFYGLFIDLFENVEGAIDKNRKKYNDIKFKLENLQSGN